MTTHRCLWRAQWRGVLLGLALASVAAAAQNGIKVYRVPKESSPESDRLAATGLVPMSESVMPALEYVTPQGWSEEPPGQMRVASFKVRAAGEIADVSVIPLPGAAGGDVPNVNRWRGQVGLDPMGEESLLASATKITIAGEPALLHELTGTNTATGDPTRIIGAIQHRDGMAWFFKMSGGEALVAKERLAFLELLKSVKFVAPKAGALPADHPPIGGDGLPAGHPEIPAAANDGNPRTPDPAAGHPKWNVPGGWKEIPAGQFLAAKFLVAGEGGASATVNVSTSAGDGGGLAANVNRWRGQLGQAAWNAAELQQQVKTVAAGGAQIAFVEMSGTDARTDQPATVVGAIVTRGDATWFYKLMGDAKVVGAQKAAFTQFVTDVKY